MIALNNLIYRPNICFFLNNALPDNVAACLYYSAPPYQNLEFLGAVANNRPSDIFTTGFPVKDDVNYKKLVKFIF